MTSIPQPKTLATDFTLLNGDAQQVKLSDYRGKNVVLAFYPADWTPVCTSEMTLIQEVLDDIHNYNAEVLGVSCDSHFTHRAWAERQHLDFPLLSDFWPHGMVAQQYGVFNEHTGISGRALFFVDKMGVIRNQWIAEDPNIAPGLSIIFDALEQLQEVRPQEASHV